MDDTITPRENLKQAVASRIQKLQSGGAPHTVVMRTNTRWMETLRCEVDIRDFAPLYVDEPPSMGGANTAPNPMELVLAALGACQEILYSAYAALLDIPLEAVEVSLTGYMDVREMFDLQHETGAGFSKIRSEARLRSSASEADIRRLVETVERCCPVMDTLQRPVMLTNQVHLNDQLLTR